MTQDYLLWVAQIGSIMGALLGIVFLVGAFGFAMYSAEFETKMRRGLITVLIVSGIALITFCGAWLAVSPV